MSLIQEYISVMDWLQFRAIQFLFLAVLVGNFVDQTEGRTLKFSNDHHSILQWYAEDEMNKSAGNKVRITYHSIKGHTLEFHNPLNFKY